MWDTEGEKDDFHHLSAGELFVHDGIKCDSLVGSSTVVITAEENVLAFKVEAQHVRKETMGVEKEAVRTESVFSRLMHCLGG